MPLETQMNIVTIFYVNMSIFSIPKIWLPWTHKTDIRPTFKSSWCQSKQANLHCQEMVYPWECTKCLAIPCKKYMYITITEVHGVECRHLLSDWTSLVYIPCIRYTLLHYIHHQCNSTGQCNVITHCICFVLFMLLMRYPWVNNSFWS